MQLIEQLVKRELVVYHEEEWQLVQYGPNSMIVHQTNNHNKYVVQKYYNIFVIRCQ